MDETGPRLTDLLYEAYQGGLPVCSRYVQKQPALVAMAASCGYITTHNRGDFGRVWFITQRGFRFLMEGE